MFTFSQFVASYNANHKSVPHATLQIIRREAVARLKERQKAGRGDCVLDFTDLVERIEKAVMS